ncbi:MupA/Atu3671 family FMN-dependent luciferase-like monooxygenase [Streptomyces sp. Isolate_45]|uniref:MupA/Atu3671 family FMN-dependent luciferase-like monooxygenase n=1 Tax=Streptomyces sp. Isolate_45 TaxID=2950111 RepID=UPI002481E680|nr:MupA/Atu3671 family FMN-dependent luciferase-like monooxygenase [Streptomyces sp. Isolate_45]MDA5282549.1 LLM class flavin-dependent oxidoreductase [Streptomyces sp. Isolate_45]
MEPDNTSELVDSLASQGVRVFLENGRLQCRGSRDALTPELLDLVRGRRDELRAHLERGSEPSDSNPLTAGQQSLLLHQRVTPDSAAYNLAFAARAVGAMDAAELDAALCEVVGRHAILRTTYTWGEGDPAQSAREAPPRILTEETATEDTVECVVETFMDSPFDLEHDLPVRAMLVRTGPDDERPVLVIVVHHIAADLWSIDVIVDEWLTAYRARTAGNEARSLPAAKQFVEHVRSEGAWLTGPEAERNLAYWRKQLGGALPVMNLPFDRPRPPAQTMRGARLSVEVDPALSQRFARIASDGDATPNMLFLSAFQVLLQKYSASDDVVVGTPTAGRRSPQMQDTVGFFADPVVVRGDLRGDPTFTEILDRTRSTLLNALDHPYPFPLLVERLSPPRDPSRPPFFQVMYVWQQTRSGGQDVPLETLSSSGQRGAPFDIVLSVHQAGGRFVCSWTYNVDLFEDSTVERLAHGYLALLGEIAARPDARVSSLPSMSPDEQRALLHEANGPQIDIRGRTWFEQFDAQVLRTPRATALVCDDETLTYEELSARVGRFAAALRARGVREEVRVGLCIERSAALVVALLATARAGGAHVPLDPAYPQDRIAYMAEDAAVALCVADEPGRRALGSYAGDVLPLHALESEAERLEPDPLDGNAAEALAYVIYTSGSTGRPKGVMVTRRNVVNLFEGLDRALGDEGRTGDEQPVWLAVTSVCFDISVLELLWTLCRGYKVVIEPELWTSHGEAPAPQAVKPRQRPVDFSLFYFAADSGEHKGKDLYRLLLDGARFADSHGFRAVWVPERHFHTFGGAYPNPAVLAGAVAAMTENIGIRAGSVVLPLQDPLRVAEEWAAVDNLSDGRVGLSFASGWQPNDFVLAPERFASRKESMWDDIDVVRRLWRGEGVPRRNGVGADIEVRTLPRPVQTELPVWATAAGSDETFRRAGETGANLLTHLLGQNVQELARKIGVYRSARAAAGHDEGVVTLMLHTFVHPDVGVVREAVSEPFKNYLRSSIDLMQGIAKGLGLDPVRHREVIVEHAFERYFTTSALFGTPESCAAFVRDLAATGVDEIACLIDFGVPDHVAFEALGHIAAVKRALAEPAARPSRTPSEAVARHGVTHMQCTPAFARLLLLDQGNDPSAGSTLSTLLVGGDASPPDLVAQLRDAEMAGVFNMYGPTETCVWSAVQRLEADDDGRVTVGGPLVNTSLYVLDAQLRPVPVGVQGELYIGGAGVGRGYWNKPALTAEKFLPDPFTDRPGARMYGTGDMVRPLGGGRFEFLGRSDHQVKVRGFRIEFGEIEAVLGSHPAVANCTVVARPDRDGDVSLVAFVVVRGAAVFDEPNVRAHARSTLPEYMVPSRIVVMDRLPLTLNGKVDRGALVRLAQETKGSPRATYLAPRNQVESLLQEIWQELLERDGVGIHENFFEVGGHSLLAARMHARITAAALGRVELVDLFTFPTIAELAAHISASGETGVQTLAAGAERRASKQKAAVRQRQRRRQGS